MAESSGLRFDPDTAQQIIARAADLQQKHLETISADQLETLAAEVGLSPEFVRLALQEHEVSPVAPAVVERRVVQTTRRVVHGRTLDRRAVVTRRDVAVSVLSALLCGAAGLLMPRFLSDAWPLMALALFSLFAALGIGFRHPSRRLGAAAGSVFGFAVVMAILLSGNGSGNGALPAFLVSIALGAALGLAGAALRRLWNRLPSERDTVIEEIVEE